MTGFEHEEHAVNVVLTFEDQDGHEWLAAAIMAPLQRSGTDEHCDVSDMPDRVFRLKRFTIVTDPTTPENPHA